MTNNFNTTIKDIEAALVRTLEKVRAIRKEGKEPSLQVAKRYESVIEDLSNALQSHTHDIRQTVLQSSYTPNSSPVASHKPDFANPGFILGGQTDVGSSGFNAGEYPVGQQDSPVDVQIKALMEYVPEVVLEPLPPAKCRIDSWYENDYGLHLDPGNGQEEICLTGYTVIQTQHQGLTLVKSGNDYYHLYHDDLLFVKLPQPNRLPLIMLDAEIEFCNQLPKVLTSIALTMKNKPDAILTNWTTGVSPSPFISFHAFN